MKQLIIAFLLIFAIMPSIKAQISPTQGPPCPVDGKFEYDAFEKQVNDIKENCTYDLLPPFESDPNLPMFKTKEYFSVVQRHTIINKQVLNILIKENIHNFNKKQLNNEEEIFGIIPMANF